MTEAVVDIRGCDYRHAWPSVGQQAAAASDAPWGMCRGCMAAKEAQLHAAQQASVWPVLGRAACALRSPCARAAPGPPCPPLPPLAPAPRRSNKDLRGKVLSGVMMQGSDFSGSSLVGSQFARASAQGAQMRGADLTDVNAFATAFDGADLEVGLGACWVGWGLLRLHTGAGGRVDGPRGGLAAPARGASCHSGARHARIQLCGQGRSSRRLPRAASTKPLSPPTAVCFELQNAQFENSILSNATFGQYDGKWANLKGGEQRAACRSCGAWMGGQQGARMAVGVCWTAVPAAVHATAVY